MWAAAGNATGDAARDAYTSCQELSLSKTDAANTDGSAILTAVILNSVQLLVATALLGCLSRSKRSRSVFAPLRAGETHLRALLGSVREAATADTKERMPIDGQIVVRLCQLGLKFFALGTLTACVLIPLYEQGAGRQKGVLRVTTSNLTQEDGWTFRAITVAAYLQAAAFFFLMHEEWGHFVRIRHRHFARVARGECGPSAAQAQYSLMVERVPKDARTPEAIRGFFAELFDGIHSCVLQRDTAELYKMQVYETATASVCCGLPCCRRTVHAGVQGIVRLERGVTRTARSTAQAVGAIAEGGATGLFGVAHTGVDLMHNIGQNIASVARWGAELSDEDQIEPASTAFVTLLKVSDRVTAEQVILFSADGHGGTGGSFKDWVVRPAPEARDILWQNVPLSASEVKYRSLCGVFICFLGFSVWTLPVTAIQAAVSRENLRHWTPRLLDLMERHLSYGCGLILGYLPVLALLGLLFFLPYVLHEFAVRFEGRKVKSDVVCVVMWRNFLFQLATLWATVFSGTISNSFYQIWDHPACVYVILGRSIPKVSVYFTSFVIARIGISLPLLLLPITSFLSLFHITKPEPQYCDFPTEAVNVAIVFVLGLMYSLVAPAILPACTVYFGLATLVYRWKFLNVYTPQFSCAGSFWAELFTGVMIGLFLGLLSLVGLAAIYAGTRTPEFYAIAVLPACAFLFHIYCKVRLAPLSVAMPYQDAVRIDRESAAQVCAAFAEDYYKDPILKPRGGEGEGSSSGSEDLGSSSGEGSGSSSGADATCA
mmetsp:Transcript_92991/g.277576  ORF Transcript_92991/g.277576 Transcript_92991/m.277576 type:complete len:773 (-) Transcript_92991:115-2433(-)